MLLELNRPRYAGLTAAAKLKEGTAFILPPRGGGWYESLDDETPRDIAAKLQIDETDLVALNDGMYPGLTPTARLMAGTNLLVPGSGAGWRYKTQRGENVSKVATKLGLDAEMLLSINVNQVPKGADIHTRLGTGTKLLVPAGANDHFLTRPSRLTPSKTKPSEAAGAEKPEAESAEERALQVSLITVPFNQKCRVGRADTGVDHARRRSRS
jgi:hypothetical protein